MTKNIFFYLSIPLLFSSGCSYKKDYHVKSTTQEVSHDKSDKMSHTITIWVHGTRALSKKVFPAFFKSIPGMQPASAYNEKNNLFTIAKTLSATDPANFPLENIYLFGWSGVLLSHARKQAARQLYKDLITLIQQRKQQYGTTPKIRMITHSHGGNVALYLAKIKKEFAPQIKIDELILLACPVQQKTINLIKDDLFKQIYSLYSKGDLIQVIDPQGVYAIIKKTLLGKKKSTNKQRTPFFSGRRFPNQDNLKQAKIKINGHAILHLDFILTKFLHHLPDILVELKKSATQHPSLQKGRTREMLIRIPKR